MDLKNIVKKYSNGEVTIVWKPSLCQHSRRCFTGLPEVFDPQNRPWVDPTGASSEDIISQIKMCPSHALSYYMNADPHEEEKEKSPE
ncbi:MAG TPA: (4Fe-4S)-binding protein [Bacteroidetes bacterium]|nr:(4Fe-4S)-binding protein [Bacteroidota bacterium]